MYAVLTFPKVQSSFLLSSPSFSSYSETSRGETLVIDVTYPDLFIATISVVLSQAYVGPAWIPGYHNPNPAFCPLGNHSPARSARSARRTDSCWPRTPG